MYTFPGQEFHRKRYIYNCYLTKLRAQVQDHNSAFLCLSLTI